MQNLKSYPRNYLLKNRPPNIARDSKYPSKYVVSERFKELCESYKFKLLFHPVEVSI